MTTPPMGPMPQQPVQPHGFGYPSPPPPPARKRGVAFWLLIGVLILVGLVFVSCTAFALGGGGRSATSSEAASSTSAGPTSANPTSSSPTASDPVRETAAVACIDVIDHVSKAVDIVSADDPSASEATSLAATISADLDKAPLELVDDLTAVSDTLTKLASGETINGTEVVEPGTRLVDACEAAYGVPSKEATEPADEPDDEPTEEPRKETKYDKLSDEQQEAYGAAQSYLDSSGFSKDGLIDQLSSEYGSDFAKKDAKKAVDALDVDWNKQAVRAAKSYRESGHFSTNGLIEQLESDYGSQFTHSEAVYGAKHSR